MLSNTKILAQLETLAEKHQITDAGRKLLEVRANPENLNCTMLRQCEMAGISQDTYYRLMKDERYQAAEYDLCRVIIGSTLLAATMQFDKQVRNGDKDMIIRALQQGRILDAPSVTHNHTHTVEAGKTLRQLVEQEKKGIKAAKQEEVIDV